MKYILIIMLLLGVSLTATSQKEGTASYYANRFHGKKTSNGERYNKYSFTAACNRFPLNSIVKVTDLFTKKSIFVKITDHIGTESRLIDLSLAAAKELGIIKRGLAKVSVSLQ